MDRHLLPDEIDQLLDGEVGFGTAPLRAHVRHCAECRAEVDEARALMRELEHLPHFAPSPAFAARVMSQVQVFVPWHVALLDTVRGWLPQSRPWQVAAGAALDSAAVALTLASLWVIARFDSAVFALTLAMARVREAVTSTVLNAATIAVGEPALDVLRGAGPLGLLLGTVVLLALIAGSAGALRALATPRRR